MFKMNEAILDEEYNYDFSNMKDDNGETFVRGGRKYIRPYGWNRVALNVKDKYDDDGVMRLFDSKGDYQNLRFTRDIFLCLSFLCIFSISLRK